MPPYVPRKRLRASTPDNAVPADKDASRVNSKAGSARKRTLYDDLDSSHTPGGSDSLLQGFGDDDSDSPLSSLSDSDFEDVPLAKRQKTEDAGDSDEDDEDDDIEFEDVEAPPQPVPDAPVASGDLELTLTRDTRISLTNQFGDKKGPSKRERKVRNATHGVHILCLLWHNAIRNSWICDLEVQAIMVSHVPPRLWDEVDRWRRNSGLTDSRPPSKTTSTKKRGGVKQESRDWGGTAKRLEEGAIDMSHGDPLFRFMRSLVAWWKQRFRVSRPGLRKWGYMSLERLDRLTKAYKDHEEDYEDFGERIGGIEDFRQCAVDCRGSRDIGAQLFTALLRGLGIDARMVASLQPLGFGWNKLEDADAEEEEKKEKTPIKGNNTKITGKKAQKGAAKKKVEEKRKITNTPSRSRSARSSTQLPTTSVEDSEDDLELEYKDTDDESVDVDLTPKTKPIDAKKFDKDLDFPHYWTEILSPATTKYLSIDPIVKGTVAVNRDLVETFEPRGAKADRARQVIAYVVGYSRDGTAKDVTVRYLKRQVLPGRTKGVRMPLEKIPIYNHHGKVKRYEMLDWFKTAMSGYRRGDKKHPITEVDQQEEATDLKPAKAEKKEVKEGEETLQFYKQSKEFALERHLKREEALRRGAEPVKVFKNKSKGGKVDEEDVYLRSDVVLVKSAETWHKQGRAPLAGEEPLKRVPYRAATLNRKREILEAEAMTGQKVLQGLYSFDQTDWIIPPPIKDGIIPKNEYGNIDLFAEHMCPKGAVHVPFRGVGKVCKRLGIDYAEAVVDFEFGHRMAVPVIQGVVIAEEHHDRVMVELEKDEAERLRKEDEKRRKAALGKWRKFLMGMRIVERIRQEYGEIDEGVSVFGHSRGGVPVSGPPKVDDEELAGGFLPEGYEEDGEDRQAHETSNFFPSLEEDDHGGDGDLIMEDHRNEITSEAETQAEAQTEAQTKKPLASRGRKPRATRRRKPIIDSEDDEESAEWEDGNDE
ncbi:xeroderma pigmentosum group c-complementing [Trichoderma arundinaceum]|uniref:Xeroderma pigmentosum group c-complementing n=1 Tax=Trichoderma arundinaceum TaxID=490622 RepID=A0A395P1C5_TRIAR|nr:xeroderma pigmentosum group c-complementing [Trichoderma arundinaceum]